MRRDIDLYDVVKTRVAVNDIAAGAVGTVLIIYDGEYAEVEFASINTKMPTYTVRLADLEKLPSVQS